MNEQELPQRISGDAISETTRPANAGAEQWLNRPIRRLNHGFVYLVDCQGNDAAIAQAARVSYGKGTKKMSGDHGLIRYLFRHKHLTPFEMVELKFHCRMPIFVARQWVRHRTANLNEESLRYSVASSDMYVPEIDQICEQSSNNKQGRGAKFSTVQAKRIQSAIRKNNERQFKEYVRLANAKQDPADPQNWIPIDPHRPMLSRELARGILPVNTYTQWYWKTDLRNLFNFLSLRLDSHAQYEIRVYAQAMARIVKDLFPIAYEAFEDYQLNSLTLSGLEIKLLQNHYDLLCLGESHLKEKIMKVIKNSREADEFIVKLKQIGFMK